MLASLWNWLLNEPAGIATRIGAAVAILAAFAAVDLRRHGRASRRCREYLFLLAAVATAILYGIANDQITVTLSWEYFQYGKLGEPNVLPPEALRWQAVRIGAMATWWVGLLLGVAMLFANNPKPGRPDLPLPTMLKLLPLPLLAAAACGALGGLTGWLGGLNWAYPDIETAQSLRPRNWMCVLGIHLGGYAGGLLGGIAAVWRVRSLRRNASVQ